MKHRKERIVKDYKYDDVQKAWVTGNGSGLINTCVECGAKLEHNKDYNYLEEWWASYTCPECKRKFKYMPSDMGQSLPILQQYR